MCPLCVGVVQVWSELYVTKQECLYTVVVLCLSLWRSGAGQVLADNVLSLRSVEKLTICDINPVPVLHVLSQNAEHCSVSSLGIALRDHPEQVRCVSMGPCCTLPTQYPSSHTCTLCVQSYCVTLRKV